MSLTHTKPAPAKSCLLCHFVHTDLKTIGRKVRRRISREKLNFVAKHQYRVPDSAACTQALELVRQHSPEFLLNHGLRSYAFAAAMAHKVKQPFDKEVLFMGSVMHDLGLVETFDRGNTFEVDGARAALDFCQSQNIDSHRAELIHEMVIHHNTVGHAHKMAPEIALLHFGAGADVAGLWLDEIHPDTMREVIAEFPRLDFKRGMQVLLRDQIRRKPDSYMAPMIELGFLKKIDNNALP
ncbi:HD domain-containing protein [Gilvimarinus chinensis]|uniref:HD domain-containing protein n=1 Tax=Gilvimarinus chinensis TaxID=396005 RepID=UPI0003727F8D|nr:HD domain-containing protein [Gilvimarinus chinensis]